MTILNSYVERVTPIAVVALIIVVIMIFAAMFLIASIESFKNSDKTVGVIFAVLYMASLAILFTMVYNEAAGRPKVTIYEVILSDDYPATKLLENYEIVEQRGEILVIRDKSIKEDQNGKGKD